MTRITNNEMEKFRLNFSKPFKRNAAPLREVAVFDDIFKAHQIEIRMFFASFEVSKDRVTATSVKAILVTPLKVCFMNPVTLTRHYLPTSWYYM